MPEKWKRCVRSVSQKQSDWCHKYPYGRDPSGKKCANPYAICGHLRKNYEDNPDKKILTGPRGGKYYINSTGTKVYLKL